MLLFGRERCQELAFSTENCYGILTLVAHWTQTTHKPPMTGNGKFIPPIYLWWFSWDFLGDDANYGIGNYPPIAPSDDRRLLGAFLVGTKEDPARHEAVPRIRIGEALCSANLGSNNARLRAAGKNMSFPLLLEKHIKTHTVYSIYSIYNYLLWKVPGWNWLIAIWRLIWWRYETHTQPIEMYQQEVNTTMIWYDWWTHWEYLSKSF